MKKHELSPAFLVAVRQRADGIVWWWIMPHLTRDEWQRIYHMTPLQAARLLTDVDRLDALPATQPLPAIPLEASAVPMEVSDDARTRPVEKPET